MYRACEPKIGVFKIKFRSAGAASPAVCCEGIRVCDGHVRLNCDSAGNYWSVLNHVCSEVISNKK